VVVHDRGRPGWQRAVHDVIADTVPAQRLLVGETFNEAGQWSSFPPHKHDGGDGEPALEEVYYYRFDRPDGFGFQGLYEHDGPERAVFLRPLRSDSAVAPKLSTVDNIEDPRGRIAAVLAVAALVQGKTGHYGIGRGADRAVPEVAP
jgi:hypothetical protein